MVNILQIVGYKKSGKTTVINQLIQAAAMLNVKVAVIKHHGDHSGNEIDIPLERDHVTYMSSGAVESIIQGERYIHKLMTNETQTLDSLIDEVSSSPDIILVEGYKHEDYPKFVLLRSEHDRDLLNLTQIVGIIDTHAINDVNYIEIIQGLINHETF